MRLANRLALIVALVLSAGCALSTALERGHGFVAAEDYRSALAAYQQARALDPDSEEAARLVEQIRPYAVDQATEQARSAVASGDWERATEHAAYVARLDSEAGEALSEEIARWMRASLEGLMAETKMERAYPLAVRARKLFPRMEGLGGAFERLREHFRARSERALAADDFRGALAALDVIERHERRRAASLKPARRRIRGAWADHLGGAAERAHEDGHAGVAAVLYARAHEVAGRSADLDRMRAELVDLEQAGRFSLRVRFDGPPERRRLRRRVVTGARELDGVRLAGEGADHASMVASLQAEPIACGQDYEARTGAQDYVAGTRMIANPAHRQLSREIEEADGAVDRLRTKVAAEEADAKDAARQARRCRDDARSLEQVLSRAESELQRRERAVEKQRERVDRLRREVRRARDPDERAERERALAEAKRELEARRQAAAESRARKNDEERALRKMEHHCERRDHDLSRIEARVAALSAELRHERRALERLERERSRTPRRVEEPIIETHHYEIRRYTRRCEAPLTVDVETGWRRGERRSVPAERITQDDTHEAHPRYGVDGDPLSFPLTDAELRAGVDRGAAEEVVALIEGYVGDYYESMAGRSFEMVGRDPDTASDMMVALWVAAPEQLGTEERARIAEHLRRRHGLESLDVLRR